MIITGYQYYSIFVYVGQIKGGYTAEDILLFQDFLVKSLGNSRMEVRFSEKSDIALP